MVRKGKIINAKTLLVTSGFLLATVAIIYFKYPALSGWILLPQYKNITGLYMHAETTGPSDWVRLEGEDQTTTIIFHEKSDPDALQTLKALVNDCHINFFETIYGDLDEREAIQKILIKGKLDQTVRLENFPSIPDGEPYRYFFLEDWYIEVPFEVLMKPKDISDIDEPRIKRTVHSYDEANCKDSRIAKHFRKSW